MYNTAVKWLKNVVFPPPAIREPEAAGPAACQAWSPTDSAAAQPGRPGWAVSQYRVSANQFKCSWVQSPAAG